MTLVSAHPAASAADGCAHPCIAMLGLRAGAGGIARVTRDLIAGLCDAGAMVDLLLPPGEFPELPALLAQVNGGVTRLRYCPLTNVKSLLPPGEFPELPAPLTADHGAVTRLRYCLLNDDDPRIAQAQLQTYLALRQPSALLSHRDHTHALLARITHRGARPPVWLRVGSDVREKIATKTWWRRGRYRAALRHSYQAADGLIANSNGVAESLRTLLGNTAPPLVVLPNPLDLSRIATLAAQPAQHPWLRVQTTPVIVALGRLVAAKDFATLIRAVAILRQQWQSPARLIIFGEGRQRPALEQLVRRLYLHEVVDLPGFTANPYSELRRADLFVLSSRFEGAPNALLEALACGTPCVATDCHSGPRDILADGQYGQLVPVGRVRALATAMATTLARPPAARVNQMAVQQHDVATAAGAYLHTLTTPPRH